MRRKALYHVKPQNGSKAFNIQEIDHERIHNLSTNLTNFIPFSLNDETFMLGFNKASKAIQVYSGYDKENDIFFKEITNGSLPHHSTILEIFYVSNKPYLLTYEPTSEFVEFFSIDDDFAFTSAYKVRVGKGLSVVYPFAFFSNMYFVAYDHRNGNVDCYQISVPADRPLYVSKPIWSDKWAAGWTRFAFFKLGGSNFFIKTNTIHGKVNIDHIMDDPALGSHPVLDERTPKQLHDLEAVSTFADQKGNPYFLTYRSNGEITFNRFNGNCKGWTIENEDTTLPNASIIQPFEVSGNNYVLVLGA